MIAIHQHPKFGPIKLGKKAKRVDPRTLQLKNYLHRMAITPAGQVTPPPPSPPAEVSWVVKVPSPWGMLGNDVLGDCVEAAQLHMVQQLTFFAGKPMIPTRAQAVALYSTEAGYVPGDPDTDDGTDMLTALNYWRQTGAAGHKITAFAEVDASNLTEVRQAVMLFGSVFIGLGLPISAQSETAWTVPDGGAFGDGSPGSWGGHCIPIMAQSPETLTCITWGSILKMSHNFFLDYCAAPASGGEAYAVITPDWIEANGDSPSGFDIATLLADLKQVTA